MTNQDFNEFYAAVDGNAKSYRNLADGRTLVDCGDYYLMVDADGDSREALPSEVQAVLPNMEAAHHMNAKYEIQPNVYIASPGKFHIRTVFEGQNLMQSEELAIRANGGFPTRKAAQERVDKLAAYQQTRGQEVA